jgi:hypothetical protein
MRWVVAGAILVLAGAAPRSVSPAAMNYPWCTSGAGHEFGGVNCGFVSLEQCLETARGNGQSCNPNPFYVPPPAATKSSHRRAKTSH